ncbi:MAG: C4-dicarboxylate ABC transporter, partial [Spirochaetales bacterium]|nr:C4-dicarboxylate ABC transporter [Spirochaetales bacterium]
FGVLNFIFAAGMIAWVLRWIFHTQESLDDFRHPGRALFYGAFAMGINVVGNDYLFIGTQLINPALAADISMVIWVAGTVASLFTVIAVPYLLFSEHKVETHQTLATWLIPVVPPIVAAATGANLLPYWAGADLQFGMLALILSMFGVTIFLFLMVSGLVYSRLVYHQRLSGEAAPSLWVEIGPIGMTMGTFSVLPVKTHAILAQYGSMLHAIGLVVSIAMWGLGIWWIIISALHSLLHLTKRGDGLPFHMGWWSYVFPIGSFTNGTYALGHLANTPFFRVAGFIQLIVLWGFFIVVASRTAFGVWNGTLLKWRASHLVHA